MINLDYSDIIVIGTWNFVKDMGSQRLNILIINVHNILQEKVKAKIIKEVILKEKTDV